MPLEVKVNFNQSVIQLPNINPGTNAIVPDYISDEVVVITCNKDDDGGQIAKADLEDLEQYHDSGVYLMTTGLRHVLEINRGKKHLDYIGLVPSAPLLIGELVIQHS